MTTFLPVTIAGVIGAIAGASVTMVHPPVPPAPPPAYFISSAEAVTDTAMLHQYGASVGKTVKDFQGNFLAAGVAVSVDSAPPPKGRFVILQFPSMRALQDWWHSSEYTAIRPLLEKSTTGGKGFALNGLPPR
jgi:uncharacterized protein (DUF1330 family)